MDRLGLVKGGGSLAAVRRRVVYLGLPVPPPLRRVRSDEWTADPTSIPTSRSAVEPGRRRWTDPQLVTAVKEAKSIAGVIRALGLKIGGAVYVVIKRRISELGLDTSHFTGQAWCKGMQRPTRGSTPPIDEILVLDSDYTSTAHLRRRLLNEGLKSPVCEICGIVEWNGTPVPLQLDHINGDRTDNRLQNLRLVCPNCHAQTDTWCGKNIGRRDSMVAKRQPRWRNLADACPSNGHAERHEGSNPSRGTGHQPSQIRLF